MWFTETPWPPIAILMLVAAGFLLALIQTQAGKWLIAAGVCVVLAMAVWFVERAIVTPAERVEANLIAMVQAFQKNDQAGMVKCISQTNQKLVLLATAALTVVDLDEGYSLSDIQISTQANATIATSHFRLNGTIHTPAFGNVGHKPFRFRGKWRIEAGEWRLTDIEDLDPITGKVLDRFGELK